MLNIVRDAGIRQARDNGVSPDILAERFGVSRRSIFRIVAFRHGCAAS